MSETLESVLIEAINDEYKARATYRLVISTFGEIRPFINIVEAEGRHIEAFSPCLKKTVLLFLKMTGTHVLKLPRLLLMHVVRALKLKSKMQKCINVYLIQQKIILMFNQCSYNYKEHQKKTIFLPFSIAQKKMKIRVRVEDIAADIVRILSRFF